MNLEFINRGISGNTVIELQKRRAADRLALKLDTLSVIIGFNDQSHGVPPEQYEQVYDALLTDAKAANPKLRLVLWEPFRLPLGKRQENYET